MQLRNLYFLMKIAIVLAASLIVSCGSDSASDIDGFGEVEIKILQNQEEFPLFVTIRIEDTEVFEDILLDANSEAVVIVRFPAGKNFYMVTWRSISIMTDIIVAEFSDIIFVSAGEVLNVAINPEAIFTDFDDDIDGFTNLEELRAGTNPLDPASRPIDN